MTVTTTVNRVQYSGSGSPPEEYSVTFKFLADEDLVVIHTDSDGTDTTLTLDSEYTVEGAGDAAGGTVTVTDEDYRPTTGEYLTIYRSLDIDQTTQLITQGGFFPKVHEDAFDYLTMLCQQNKDEIDRCLKYDATTPDADIDTDITAAIDARDAAEAAQTAAEAAQTAAEAAQTAAEAARDAVGDADTISYDNSTSGLTATDVQAGVDELAGRTKPAETATPGIIKTATASTVATGTATDEAVTPAALMGQAQPFNLSLDHMVQGRLFGNWKTRIYDAGSGLRILSAAPCSDFSQAAVHTGGLALSETPTAVVPVDASNDFQGGIGILASAPYTLVFEVECASAAAAAAVVIQASVQSNYDADGIFAVPRVYNGNIGGVTAYWPTLLFYDASGNTVDLSSIGAAQNMAVTVNGYLA